jgi:nucleoside-diphosphate-sugar epimerase
MVRPASEGMQTILDAAVANGVKKLVVTSSLATMMGNVWKSASNDYNYSELDFAPYETSDTYTKSKIAQEAIIRYFVEMQEKGIFPKGLEIVTLHPSAVFGPTYL